MDSPSEVSAYLDNLENGLMDVGDVVVRMEEMIDKEKCELIRKGKDVELMESEPEKLQVVTFTRAKLREYDEPGMRYSTPCGIEGLGAWDVECNLWQHDNYVNFDFYEKFGNGKYEVDKYNRR